jgi:DNA-binding beta-propeller fold protein YncE
MIQNPFSIPSVLRFPGRGTAALLLTVVLAPALACKKGENAAAAPGSTSPAAPAATPAPPPDAAPTIRDTAETGRAPWSGLAEPRGASLDGHGRLWVTDFGHSRIAIFDLSGGYLGGWGGVKGNGKYQLQDPGDVTVHGEDVYVADTWNGRVQQYAASGAKFVRTAVSELYGPRGVAVAPDGVVWVADSGNNRMALLAPGQPPRFVGKSGAGADGLSFPVGVAASPSHVFVADIGNHRIQVFGLDGRVQRSIPVAAWKETMEPYLAVDDRENIYASVPAASQVLELDRSGRVLRKWDADEAGRKFVKPTGLALDGKAGILYVVDAGGNTVAPIHLEAKKS